MRVQSAISSYTAVGLLETQPSAPLLALMDFRLVKTKRRLTLDIIDQRPDTRYQGDDDGPYFYFKASNGYEIISRSRMDIQTERVWLLGAKPNERSGSMVFSSDEKRDKAYNEFITALNEWAEIVVTGNWGPREG
jgi:hypothetical protein